MHVCNVGILTMCHSDSKVLRQRTNIYLGRVEFWPCVTIIGARMERIIYADSKSFRFIAFQSSRLC